MIGCDPVCFTEGGIWQGKGIVRIPVHRDRTPTRPDPSVI